MHVAILGAKGMLGHALVQEFQGEEITAWDKEELDITDEQAVGEYLAALEPDIVMNAAAYTDVERAEDEPDEADAVNGHAVGNLAVTCGEADIPLLHLSTDYVFQGTKGEGYAEDDEPMNPVNAYGRSKLLGETLLKETGKNFWLVRTAWLFGPHGKNFVETIRERLNSTTTLRVVSDQHGSLTYTKDLARALHTLITDRAPYGTYHLINSGVATWADIAAEIARLLNKNILIERIASADYQTKARRPLLSTLRNTKRPPLRPWNKAVADYLRNPRASAA
ncbi:MAG: dTDP-4-dehydrorhamnose reductase [Parcubacteria group bacterium Gr01-1014_38]|nr:MAG: dTDP-4-dehydrorhamnose reductase [Parcubacteria group bacterium Gr01-1014_38]